jgi:hypothetical protein
LRDEIEGKVWTLPAKRIKAARSIEFRFRHHMAIVSSSGKTDDAPEQEWFQLWNSCTGFLLAMTVQLATPTSPPSPAIQTNRALVDFLAV